MTVKWEDKVLKCDTREVQLFRDNFVKSMNKPDLALP